MHTLLRACCSCVAVLTLLAAAPSHALTADEARAIASGDTEARVAALNKAVVTADDKTSAFIQAMVDDAVKTTEDKVFVMKDDKGFDPVTDAELTVPDTAEDVVNNNMMRGALDAAQSVLKLVNSKDEEVRLEAANALLKEPDESRIPMVEKALAVETSATIKARLELVRAASLLNSTEPARRIVAANALAESKSPDTKLLLNERLTDETDPGVRKALEKAIAGIDDVLVWGDRINAIFSGISLGSVLLLAALGLAITYGLMGVINMAHGELMMIGAYATYVVQGLFQKYLPESAFGLYLVAAIPVAFLASALVGAILERGVILFLYG